MRSRHAPTHPYQDDTRGPRIQKVLAEAGVGSRRACEDVLAEGRCTVNGHRIDGLPAWVNPAEDDIRVDGRRIKAPESNIYVMLFKPKGTLATNADPEGRRTALDLVAHPSKARLFPVGRLEMDGSGLLLLTNDGAMANRLTHPRFETQKGYEVLVGGKVSDAELSDLRRAIFAEEAAPTAPGAAPAVAGSTARRPQLVVLNRESGRTLLYLEFRERRNHDLRRVMQMIGHPVKKLRRVRLGPLQLKGLQPGEWRELTSRELSALRAEAFATPQERARRKEREPVARKPGKGKRRAPVAAEGTAARGGRRKSSRAQAAERVQARWAEKQRQRAAATKPGRPAPARPARGGPARGTRSRPRDEDRLD
jgi:pseudouridine synthase